MRVQVLTGSHRLWGKRYGGCHLLVAEIGANKMLVFPMYVV